MGKENFNLKKEIDKTEKKSSNTYKIKDLLVKNEAVSLLLGKNIPVIPRTKLIRISKALRNEIEIYDEVRITKAKLYSDDKEVFETIEDEKGRKRQVSKYEIPPEKQEKFDKEVKLLQEQEVEIKVAKIPISEFDACKENIGGLLAVITDFLII